MTTRAIPAVAIAAPPIPAAAAPPAATWPAATAVVASPATRTAPPASAAPAPPSITVRVTVCRTASSPAASANGERTGAAMIARFLKLVFSCRRHLYGDRAATSRQLSGTTLGLSHPDRCRGVLESVEFWDPN